MFFLKGGMAGHGDLQLREIWFSHRRSETEGTTPHMAVTPAKLTPLLRF
jgi:hypothetical protein